MATFLIGLAILAAIAIVIVRRGLQMKRLTEGGVDGIATVVKVESVSGSGGQARDYLTYEFRAGGRKFKRRIHMSSNEIAPYEEGGTLEIVYLPGDPGVSGAKAMVEQLRDVVKK